MAPNGKERQKKEYWHWSKSVSIVTALALLGNFVVMIYQFGEQKATFTAAFEANRAASAKNEVSIRETQRQSEAIRDTLRAEINGIQRETSAQAVAIGRIEVGIQSIQETLKQQARNK